MEKHSGMVIESGTRMATPRFTSILCTKRIHQHKKSPYSLLEVANFALFLYYVIIDRNASG